MIILGIIALIVGLVFHALAFLVVVGVVLIVVGLILAVAFRSPYAGGGAAPWYHRRWY